MSTWHPSERAIYAVACCIRDGAKTVRECQQGMYAATGGKLSAEAITKVGGILAKRGHITATETGNGPGKGGWHWEYALLSMPAEPPMRVWETDEPVRREVRKPIQGNCQYPQPECLLAQVWRLPNV